MIVIPFYILLGPLDRSFHSFLPIVLFSGPWFVGHLVLDHIGVAFIWGQFVDGQYLPVGFTFIFAAIFVSDNSLNGTALSAIIHRCF